MKIKIVLYIVFLFLISVYSQDNSRDQTVFYNYCPFECCQFGQWVIKDNINVYPAEGDTGSISFKLQNNDTIYAETGNLHFLQVGKVLVTDSVYGYEPGDTLSMYNCVESEFRVRYKGEEKFVDTFWPIFMYRQDDTESNYLNKIKEGKYSGKMIQRPESVWWVKLKSKKGDGWIRLINRTPYCFSIKEKISGMDGCGG